MPTPTRSGTKSASAAPVHEGTVHELSGIADDLLFHGLPYPDRPHFSAFTWAACDAAYRNPEAFASSAEAVDLEEGAPGPTNSMLSMGGYPASPLPGARAAILLAHQGQVVGGALDRVHRARPHRLLRDARPGRAERRVLRGHPGPHHHGQLRAPGRAGPRRSRVVESSPSASWKCSLRLWPPAASTRRTTSLASWSRRRSQMRTAKLTGLLTQRSTRSPSSCLLPARARPGSRWASPSLPYSNGQKCLTPYGPTGVCCAR